MVQYSIESSFFDCKDILSIAALVFLDRSNES